MGSLYLSFFNVDIEDTDQTGWTLIYVFTRRTGNFLGHAAAHMMLSSK